jgi:hypothetical protein
MTDDRERDAALTAVAHALTAEEREQFLAYVRAHWPRLVGADVADVLEHTTDYDRFLDQTEPFFEKCGDHLPDTPGLIFAAHVLIILGRHLTPGSVLALLQQAGVVDAPLYPDVRVSLRLEDGADANALLVVGRAEQALRAHAVGERLITQFRGSVRWTGQPGMAYALADVARWVTLADTWEEPVVAPYDPVRDLAVLVVEASKLSGAMLGPTGYDALNNLRHSIGLDSADEAEAHLRALLRGPGRNG